MFNLLCERADNVHGGRLPHHVRVLWDEAANTGQVPSLEKLVAVIRSREVSLCLFYQQYAQCKAIYKDNAETILGNMDSVIFLGGRESYSEEEHADHLKMVLQRLREHQLYAKLSKCEFWINEVLFLGHIINKERLVVDPKKVADILNWKAPTDASGIKSFIGMAGYYRRFIEGFSKIARPMTALLAKKVEFKWTKSAKRPLKR